MDSGYQVKGEESSKVNPMREVEGNTGRLTGIGYKLEGDHST